jgi:hypothetical protein
MKNLSAEQKKSSGVLRQAQKSLRENSKPAKNIQSKELGELVHELKVHQIELEMQNEQLRQMQIELENSRSKYTDLFDFAPIGYFVFDKKGLTENVNLTGAALLGIERNFLIKKKPFLLHVDKNDRGIFYSH